jgi:hypothetical protein
MMHALSADESIWVLSGFRTNERISLEESLRGMGFGVVWQAESCHWSAVAIKSEK